MHRHKYKYKHKYQYKHFNVLKSFLHLSAIGTSFYCMSVSVYTHTCQCTRACKSVVFRESRRKTCREKENTVKDFSSSLKIKEPGVEELERMRT